MDGMCLLNTDISQENSPENIHFSSYNELMVFLCVFLFYYFLSFGSVLEALNEKYWFGSFNGSFNKF
jgi:hypothetical protein